MFRKLTVTEKHCMKAQLKRYLTATVCVSLCSVAHWIQVCFPLATFFFFFLLFSVKPVESGLEGSSLDPAPPVNFRCIPSLSPCLPYATYPSAYTAVTISGQTNNLLFVCTNIIPTSAPSARWAGSEQMHQEWGGGRVAAGYKNAYSSLWLVTSLLLAAWGWG